MDNFRDYEAYLEDEAQEERANVNYHSPSTADTKPDGRIRFRPVRLSVQSADYARYMAANDHSVNLYVCSVCSLAVTKAETKIHWRSH